MYEFQGRLLDVHPQDTGEVDAVGHADGDAAAVEVPGARKVIWRVGGANRGQGCVIDDASRARGGGLDVIVNALLRARHAQHGGGAVERGGLVGCRGR